MTEKTYYHFPTREEGKVAEAKLRDERSKNATREHLESRGYVVEEDEAGKLWYKPPNGWPMRGKLMTKTERSCS